MKRFSAKLSSGLSSRVAQVSIVERFSDTGIQRIYFRPSYTMTEAVNTAVWLNERENGYPVPAELQHLHTGG